MTLRDDLIAAKARIDTPEKWLPGWLSGVTEGKMDIGQAVRSASLYSEDHDGDAVNAMCGALDSALPGDFTLDEHNGLRSYVQWLDAASPSHDDVMALFDRAIAAA